MPAYFVPWCIVEVCDLLLYRFSMCFSLVIIYYDIIPVFIFVHVT